MVQDRRRSDIRHPAGKMERVALHVYLALLWATFVVRITVFTQNNSKSLTCFDANFDR